MDFKPTNLPVENEYPKLVRDRIPEKIKNDKGKGPPTRILTDDKEFLEYLAKKLLEEGSELRYALEHGNLTPLHPDASNVNENTSRQGFLDMDVTGLTEEMADVFEIITAILKVKGLTIEDIIAVQKEKREKNGAFEKRILMLKKE